MPAWEKPIRRHSWKWIAAAVLVALVVLWLVRSKLAAPSFDWKLLASTVRTLRWQWLAISVIPIFGTLWGRAIRWAVLLKPLKEHPSFGNLLSATLIGFAAITILGRPGELVRPYLIASKERVPVTSQLAAWVLERICDLLMALAIFSFALVRVRAAGPNVGATLAWVLSAGGKTAGLAALALLVLLFAFRHLAEPARHRLIGALRFLPEAQFRRVEKLISAFVQGVESTRSDGALVLLLLYSILEWALIAACFWCCAKAFSGVMDLALADVLVLLGFVAFGSVVQIPGIGGGMQVVTVLVLTEIFKIRVELATSFALVNWIITLAVIVPLGLAAALREGLNWGSLKRIGREVPS